MTERRIFSWRIYAGLTKLLEEARLYWIRVLPWPRRSPFSLCGCSNQLFPFHNRVRSHTDWRKVSSEWKSELIPVPVPMTIALHDCHARSCGILASYKDTLVVELTLESTCNG